MKYVERWHVTLREKTKAKRGACVEGIHYKKTICEGYEPYILGSYCYCKKAKDCDNVNARWWTTASDSGYNHDSCFGTFYECMACGKEWKKKNDAIDCYIKEIDRLNKE